MRNDSEKLGLVEMTRALLRKMSGFFDVSDTVVHLFDEICTDKVDLRAGSTIVQQDGDYGDIYLLESGWVMRARHLDTGGRQIVNVGLPGDFVAMNALLFKTSDFELNCKTDVTAYRFSSSRLGDALSRDAVLSSALFWVNAHEESMLAERIVSLGRRSARQRTAHVLCEFIARLEIIGIEEVGRLAIPLSQDEFSDILGISIVHMNKTLRALERDQVLSFRNAMLMIMDRKRLEREAGFEKGYLHFTRRNDRNAWKPDRLIT